MVGPYTINDVVSSVFVDYEMGFNGICLERSWKETDPRIRQQEGQGHANLSWGSRASCQPLYDERLGGRRRGCSYLGRAYNVRFLSSIAEPTPIFIFTVFNGPQCAATLRLFVGSPQCRWTRALLLVSAYT